MRAVGIFSCVVVLVSAVQTHQSARFIRRFLASYFVAFWSNLGPRFGAGRRYSFGMGGDGLPWPPATSLPVQQAAGLRLAGLRCLRAWAIAGLELLTVYVFGNFSFGGPQRANWRCKSGGSSSVLPVVFFAAAKLTGTCWLLE